MGHAVKSVTKVLTGKGGSSKQTTKENTTANKTENTQSWYQQNPVVQQMENQTIAEMSKFTTPKQELAGVNGNITTALNNLAQGVDASKYKSASEYATQLGQSLTAQGQQGLGAAQQTINQFANMTQEDYQNMLSNEYNSALVKSQISEATQDINEQRDEAIHSLNQRATASGAMGSSRAGVAQGVITGKALRAVGSAEVQYRTAEESAASNRLQQYFGNMMQVAGQQSALGQAQLSAGNTLYGQGMTYYGQYNSAITQNAQNMLTAGNMQRQLQQEQLNNNRYNQILAQSPSYQRMIMLNQAMLPMAGLSTSSTGTTTQQSTSVTNTPTQSQGLLQPLMSMGGMAMGNSGMLSFLGGNTEQQTQAGGMFGGMFANAFSH